MATETASRAEVFKKQVEEKIQGLVKDFAEGNISREQFQVIYERYNNQLDLANQAVYGSRPDALAGVQQGPSTIAIRNSLMGKAIGMMIYHNNSGRIVETLGDFDAPLSEVSRILNDITMMMDEGKSIERRVEKFSDRAWLVFSAGKSTTLVTLFHNEPSKAQNVEIERLHTDFENANTQSLNKSFVDESKLAYPFIAFIKKKMKK